MIRKTSLVAAVAFVAGVFAVPASAQQVFVHGYASQGYGQSSDWAQAGLGVDGTGDLRAAALQARVAFFSTGTQFVVQGAHRRVGGSPLAGIIDDVELDWAFAEQRVGDFSARVGRVPIPKGLVNEVRDVGILLPFYQASKAFYTDGIQTVDGATLRYTGSFGGFDVEAQSFAGQVPVVISYQDQQGVTAIDVDGEDTYGGQFTVGLPIDGARILGGMFDSDIYVGPEGFQQELDWEWKWISAEFVRENYYARVEHNWSYVSSFQKSTAYYVQAGFQIYPKLWLNGQTEQSHVEILDPQALGFEYDPTDDWAVGLSYQYSSKLVFKGEQHFSSGFNLDQPVNILGSALSNRYFLLSAAVAF